MKIALFLFLLSISTPAVADEAANRAAIPRPPAEAALPAAAKREMDSRALLRCAGLSRSCHVEPGVGVVMEPIK